LHYTSVAGLPRPLAVGGRQAFASKLILADDAECFNGNPASRDLIDK